MPRRPGAAPRRARRAKSRAPRGAVSEAVRLLARRSRPESELRGRLAGRHDPAEIEAALALLRHRGYLDDEAWARRYVESARGSGRGAALLARELRARGIDAETAGRALSGRDEHAAARRAARARLRRLAGRRGPAPARSLAAFLLRRGFACDVVEESVRALLQREPDGPGGEPGGVPPGGVPPGGP